MLASLDPQGLPLAVEVLSGEQADDPLYLPAVGRMRASLGQRGFLYVGDCKMGALSTRAGIHAGNDFFPYPLPAIVVPPERLEQLLTQAWSSPKPQRGRTTGGRWLASMHHRGLRMPRDDHGAGR